MSGCALHMKCVFAGWQRRVACDPSVTANFNPVAIQSLQFVSIAVGIWIEISECSETQREDVLVVSERDIAGMGDGFPQWRAGPNLYRPSSQLEIGQNQGHGYDVLMTLSGKKANPPLNPPKNISPLGLLKQASQPVKSLPGRPSTVE